jgi:hypothetical protein
VPRTRRTETGARGYAFRVSDPHGRVSSRRPGRRTNLALLALVALALVTGTASYAVGAAPATTVVTTAHALVGLALVLLVPWKQAVARRGLRRPPHAGRTAGLLLAALLALTVGAGIAQETVGWTSTLAVTPLQVHVTAALLSAALLVGHLVTHWQRPRRADLSRRTFLAGGLVLGGGFGAVVAIDRLTRVLGLPGADDRATGSTEEGSFEPERMPVTQWFTDDVPPQAHRDVPLRLVSGGRVARIDLTTLGSDDEVEAVLDCTGGWFARQRWRGVTLDRLLPRTLPASARSIDVVSVTGYRRRFALDDAPRLLLATHVGGARLSPGHGAPRRLVAPGRRGFWWVKWVSVIEVRDEPAWLQPPFPLQ